jgi:hypothetical protein
MAISQSYRVSIEAEGAAARPDWEHLVAQDANITLAKTPEWIDCICSFGNFSDATLLFRGEDGRRMILPRLRKAGIASSVRLFESPPHGWDLGAEGSGFLSEGGPASRSETRALIQEICRHSGVRTRIMVGRDDAELWVSTAPKTIYSTSRIAQVLDLRGGFPTVWSERFTSKVRSNSRKAERRGVVVESDSAGRLLPVFYTLYRSSIDRWAQDRGLPLTAMRWLAQRRNSQDKFATVARRMGKRCTIWIAWRGGEPLAGIFVLTQGSWATYWRGAMDKERSRGTGANELLHRHAIEDACARGQQTYNFGIYQTEDLKKFKSSFGAVEVPVRTYYFERLPTAAAEARGHQAAKQVIRAAARIARTAR